MTQQFLANAKYRWLDRNLFLYGLKRCTPVDRQQWQRILSTQTRYLPDCVLAHAANNARNSIATLAMEPPAGLSIHVGLRRDTPVHHGCVIKRAAARKNMSTRTTTRQAMQRQVKCFCRDYTVCKANDR